MTPLEVAEAFVGAINAGDVARMTSLMAPGHTFFDADGSAHAGKDAMSAGWKRYFEMVPDFRIEISDRFHRGNIVIMLGRAAGTFVKGGELRAENSWSVPAAWRVIVEAERVAVWQLFANQHEMHEILKRIGGSG